MIGERGKLILRAGTWSLIAKAAAAANLFVSVPFVLSALGPDEFGAWATLVSLVVFAGFLDFGFGNGTMNLVAAAHGRGEPHEVAAIVHEARRTLAWVAAVVATVFLLALPWIPWFRLLGLHSEQDAASRFAAGSVLLAIVLAIPLNLATRVQLGLGRGEQAFRWQAAGQLATVCIVIALARTNATLPVLTAAAVLTPLLANLGNNLALHRDPAMAAPVTRRSDLARRIRGEGALFFILQLAAALSYSADLPLISAMRGPSEAGTYAVVQRVFSIIPLCLGLIWAPLWPIYRQALASGNHDWVVRTLRRTVIGAVAFAGCTATALVVGFDQISTLWLRESLTVTPALLAGFAVWVVIDAAGNSLATFLNAASVVRFQVLVASIFAATCLLTKYLGILYLGACALPYAAACTFILFNLAPTLMFGRRLVGNVLKLEY